jgi:hypothetical protein
VVDLNGLVGLALGGTTVTGDPMKEIAFYRTTNANTWAAKTPRINRRTGDFHLYGNDIRRGLDIYRFQGAGKPSKAKGRWMTPAQAEARALTLPRVALTPDTAFRCLLP